VSGGTSTHAPSTKITHAWPPQPETITLSTRWIEAKGGRRIMVAMAAKVRLEVADGVATVSLNRPERHNAIDDELHEQMVAAWGQALADLAAHVVQRRRRGAMVPACRG
jgi:hypothetical protein